MLKFLVSMVFIVFIIPAYAEEKLIFTIDVVRHGDRTPILLSAKMQEIWPGMGQLTPKGMRQEYQLGKKLRQKYIKKLHLLPQSYNPDTMNVRSSGMPRTMMSAQSLLLGLYPLGTGPTLDNQHKALPAGFQPIPIHTVPLEQDTLLIPTHNKQRFNELLAAYILNDAEWKQKDLSLQPHYAKWSKILNIPISHLTDLILVSDQLFIEQLYRISPPEALSTEEIKTIIDAGIWAWIKIVNHPKLALPAGYELAQLIEQELNIARKQPNRPLKYLLFMAHDTTIAAQLQLLNQTISEIPPYASALNYSLYEVDSSTYEIRITYNQTPLLLDCGYSCRIEDFFQMIDQRLEKLDAINYIL